MPEHTSPHRPPRRHKSSGDEEQWNGNTEGLRILGYGVSGIIFELSDTRVVKISRDVDERNIEDLETERRAYRKLRKKPSNHVVKCYDFENPYGIVLEKCEETVRKRIHTRHGDPVSEKEAVRWACEAAKGLLVVHSCGIIQGDVGCHNMLLDSNGVLKIADFAGSQVDGCGASVDYEVGSKMPVDGGPTIKTDLFALGSTIYEMVLGKKPNKGKAYTDIQRQYKRMIFPSADLEASPALKAIVLKCWQQKYDTAYAVLLDLERIHSLQPNLTRRKGNVSKPSRVLIHNLHSPYSEVQGTTEEDTELAVVVSGRDAAQKYVHSSKFSNHKGRNRTYDDAYARTPNKKYEKKIHSRNPIAEMIRVLWSGRSRPRHSRKYYA